MGSSDEGRSARVTVMHVEAIGLQELADGDGRSLEGLVGQEVLNASADLVEKAARSFQVRVRDRRGVAESPYRVSLLILFSKVASWISCSTGGCKSHS